MDPRIPEPPESPRLFRPRGVGEILQHAFQLYRLHWANLALTVALIVVPLAVIQVLFVDLVIDDTFGETVRRGGREVVDVGAGATVVAALVGAIATILMWAVVTGAITRAAAGTFLGRDLDIGESYRYGLARLGSILLVGLLTGLAIAGGFILLVIPGFFILTRLTCAMPALVIEDRRGSNALSRSWNLVAGHGWPVFGTIIVAGLISGIVSGVLTAPFDHNTLGRMVAQSIAAIVTTPYMSLVGILIYLDVRVRKERYGPADLDAELARAAAP
jgi:hypothetical protein